MNLPNRLTLLRVCMIPLFVVFARMGALWAQAVAVGIYALATRSRASPTRWTGASPAAGT